MQEKDEMKIPNSGHILFWTPMFTNKKYKSIYVDTVQTDHQAGDKIGKTQQHSEDERRDHRFKYRDIPKTPTVAD